MSVVRITFVVGLSVPLEFKSFVISWIALANSIFYVSMNREKCDSFEYIIDLLSEQQGIALGTLGVLSLLKILFFVVGASCNRDEEGLTQVFDNFYAMPYGPVESDIYNAIKQQNGRINKYSIRGGQTVLNSEYEDMSLSEEQKKRLARGVDALLAENPQILSYSPFELVEISHYWNCWYSIYSEALHEGVRSKRMPGIFIQYSNKYYGLETKTEA